MNNLELAKEHIEHAGHQAHGAAHEAVPHGRRAAIVIAVLAAALAICELQAKKAQVGTLTRFIAASDTWAQYQAKSDRRTTYSQTADVLDSLPSAADPTVHDRIAAARKSAERMRSDPGADGMEQLSTRARGLERERDVHAERQERLEVASGGLQLAIVLTSVSVVTEIGMLLLVGGGLGLASAAYALAVALSLI